MELGAHKCYESGFIDQIYEKLQEKLGGFVKEEIEKCKSALRDQSPGSVDLRQSMINIQNAKYGNSAYQSVLPRPSIDERKKIIDNMRRENQKRFNTGLNSVMSTKTPGGEKGDLSPEPGPALSVQQTI